MQTLETSSSTNCQDSLHQTPRRLPSDIVSKSLARQMSEATNKQSNRISKDCSPVVIYTWDMDGPPLRTPPRPLIDDIDEPPPSTSIMRDPTYEAKRNQKKAVLAWSSWQRFVGS
jgi:hypothetical protein